jgi:hypothetical protein
MIMAMIMAINLDLSTYYRGESLKRGIYVVQLL